MNRHVQGFVCKKVWEGGAPVLHVTHDEDGAWQFLCRDNEHTSPDEAGIIHARHMFDLHPDLAGLATLRRGFYAWRDAVWEPWQTYRMSSLK